jgi:hypothetical protein
MIRSNPAAISGTGAWKKPKRHSAVPNENRNMNFPLSPTGAFSKPIFPVVFIPGLLLPEGPVQTHGVRILCGQDQQHFS